MSSSCDEVQVAAAADAFAPSSRVGLRHRDGGLRRATTEATRRASSPITRRTAPPLQLVSAPLCPRWYRPRVLGLRLDTARVETRSCVCGVCRTRWPALGPVTSEVGPEAVRATVYNIYRVPLLLNHQGVTKRLLQRLDLPPRVGEPERSLLASWVSLAELVDSLRQGDCETR